MIPINCKLNKSLQLFPPIALGDPSSAANRRTGAPNRRPDHPNRRTRHGHDLRRAQRVRSPQEDALLRPLQHVPEAGPHVERQVHAARGKGK